MFAGPHSTECSELLSLRNMCPEPRRTVRSGQLWSFLTGTSFRFNSAASSSWPASCSTCKRPHRYLPSLSLSWWQKSVTCVWHMSEEDPGPAVLNILPSVPCKEKAQLGLKPRCVPPKPAWLHWPCRLPRVPPDEQPSQLCDPNTKGGCIEGLSFLFLPSLQFLPSFYPIRKSDSLSNPWSLNSSWGNTCQPYPSAHPVWLRSPAWSSWKDFQDGPPGGAEPLQYLFQTESSKGMPLTSEFVPANVTWRRRQWQPTPVLCLENPMDG